MSAFLCRHNRQVCHCAICAPEAEARMRERERAGDFAPTPSGGAALPLTAEERAAWTIRKAPPTYGEAALLLLRYEATVVALESQLLAARRGEHAAREELAAAEEAESGRFRTHREWALANVRRAGEGRPKTLSCGHSGAEFQTCVVCAHDLGRREGQVEAGAYLLHDEAMSNIRAALAATPEEKC